MQEAANKGKDAGRCPACGRVKKKSNNLYKNTRILSFSLQKEYLADKCGMIVHK